MGVPTGRSRRVLVVDDNEDAVESLADALLELGHTVETAYDGPAALGLLQRYTPDVAFLDVGLPVMDGYELARRIREDHRFARTVLVAVTGYGQKRDQVQSREAGFDAHLVKPVDLRAIEEIIARDAEQARAVAPGPTARSRMPECRQITAKTPAIVWFGLLAARVPAL